MSVGKNLRYWRNRKGLTVRELSARCDSIYHSDIIEIEHGRNITIKTLYRLAKALNISPKELLDENPEIY